MSLDRITITFFPPWLVATMFCLSAARAEVVYTGDGSAGGLVPDFPQIWSVDQKIKSICVAAVNADVVWYWDQHGYAGLVRHQDPNKPNSTWREDGKALVFEMAERVYGKDPATARLSAKRGGDTVRALTAYIAENKKLYNKQTNPNGLAITGYTVSQATEANWYRVVESGAVASATASWRNATGGNYQDPRIGDVLHGFASAGYDDTRKALIVTHGWDDHPAEAPPYKKPPYAANEKAYIKEYPYEVIAATKRMKIPKAEGIDLFTYDADHIQIGDFFAVAPAGKTQINGKVGAASQADMNRYEYVLENTAFDPIFQFALETLVPFSLDNVGAPTGWSVAIWNSAATPDITPLPVFAPEFGDEQDGEYAGTPSRGILWTTAVAPVLAGESLEGFFFEVSSSYPSAQRAGFTVLSNGLSRFDSASGAGLISEYSIAPGPVPLPGSLLFFVSALAATAWARIPSHRRK